MRRRYSSPLYVDVHKRVRTIAPEGMGEEEEEVYNKVYIGEVCSRLLLQASSRFAATPWSRAFREAVEPVKPAAVCPPAQSLGRQGTCHRAAAASRMSSLVKSLMHGAPGFWAEIA